MFTQRHEYDGTEAHDGPYMYIKYIYMTLTTTKQTKSAAGSVDSALTLYAKREITIISAFTKKTH